MSLMKTAAVAALGASLLSGCVVAEADDLPSETVVRTISGSASWYGPRFHGRKTANGERYDMNKLTAAHKTLPFGTKVRVTNDRTGQSVVVRINDRGPFVGKRVIDLSKGAASAVGLIASGVAPVKLEILEDEIETGSVCKDGAAGKDACAKTASPAPAAPKTATAAAAPANPVRTAALAPPKRAVGALSFAER